MLQQKTKQTTRKFYGKWLYKVSISIEGAALLRLKNLDEIENFLTGPNPDCHYYSFKQRAWHNKDIILPFVNFIKKYNKDVYSLRIEGSIIDVYSNDKDFYDLLSIEFEKFLRNRFEPSETNIDILNANQNYISVDKLPKGRYNYRVYLLPHKMKNDVEGKQKYIDWLKRNNPKITCTPAVENWFIKTDWNWDRRYVLVEDEATLLMLKLRNSEVVGRIYNYVVSDK